MFSPSQKRSLFSAVDPQKLSLPSFELHEDKELRIVHIPTGFYFRIWPVEMQFETPTRHKVTRLYTYATPAKTGAVYDATKEESNGPLESWEKALPFFNKWLAWLKQEYDDFADPEPEYIEASDNDEPANEPNGYSQLGFHPLASMHGLVHHSAGKLFVDGHYPQALLAACTALDKVLQQHTGQPAELTGTALMNKVFSPDNPLIRLSAVKAEQQGYLLLFNGLTQAIRNHYAHNLTELSNVNRALEWLGFISALCHRIQDAVTAERSSSSPEA